MKHTLPANLFARLIITCAGLMIIVYLIGPTDAWADADAPHSTIAAPSVSLPYIADMREASAPVIISEPVLAAQVGEPYTYTVQATGVPAPRISLQNPPAGMAINETVIQWTPASVGSFPVIVVASNGTAPDAVQSFTVNVVDPYAIPERVWDPRLDQRGAKLVEADVQPGQGYWRLVEARWLNSEESQGRHHIYVDVLDENGVRKVGVPILIGWTDGSATVVTEAKPGEPYAANYAMYAVAPAYSAQPYAGVPADRVEGMGLGELNDPAYGHHTSYELTWRWTVAPR